MTAGKMQFEYGPDDRVPFIKSFLLGLQWAAILISSVIILGKVIGGLHFSDQLGQVVYLQKLLFLSAVTLFCQIFWGHRLPIIPGPAAVLLIGVIASKGFGMEEIYSSVMIGGFFIAFLAVSGLFSHFQRLFTSNVVAVVLLLIAFTIAPTIRDLMVDSKSGISPMYNFSFALTLILIMFLFYRILSGIWKSAIIIWAIIAGSFSYFLIFPAVNEDNLFTGVPWFRGFFDHMLSGFSIQPGVLISFVFCYIALSVNDMGSIQAVNEMVAPGQEEKRITRGISLTGLANVVSGFFGVIGPVNYSLSPGVIASTRCASRYTLVPAAAVIFTVSFLPAVTGFLGSVPSVVIGAVLAYVMSSQVAAGLLVAFGNGKKEAFSFEKGLVIGISILLSTIVAFFPQQVAGDLPSFLRPILGNGFVVGVMSALILEHLVIK